MKHASQLVAVALLLVATGLCGCSLISPLVGAAAPYAGVKLYFACLPEHTLLDTPCGRRPVEQLEAGYRICGVPVNSMIEEMNAAAASGKAHLRRQRGY